MNSKLCSKFSFTIFSIMRITKIVKQLVYLTCIQNYSEYRYLAVSGQDTIPQRQILACCSKSVFTKGNGEGIL